MKNFLKMWLKVIATVLGILVGTVGVVALTSFSIDYPWIGMPTLFLAGTAVIAFALSEGH